MSDLVNRLRDRGVCSLAHNSCRNDMVCEQAADRIEALEAALEAERDDYAWRLYEASNTYTEMHIEIERLSDENERLREALKKYTCACSPLQVCTQNERDFPDCGWTARTALEQNRSD